MHKSVRTRALQCPNSGICDAPQQITYMGLCHAQQTKIRHNCCNPDPAKCRGPQKKPTLFCPVLSFPLQCRGGWTPGPHPLPRARHGPPPPSATPRDTKEWETETWVARMASLSNFRHHVPGDVHTPDNQQPSPSTYMTLMYNLHYTLSTTNYHAPTGHWVVHGNDSLLPDAYAPPTQPRPRHVHQGGRAGRPPPLGHAGNASPWTRCSPSAAATRALVGRCIALPSLRRLKLHGIKRQKVPKYRASKNIKRTILWLAKNQAVFETPKELLCNEFRAFSWS